MKNSIFIILAFISLQTFSQEKICGPVSVLEAPENTYFKDIDNTFANFIGTWQYTNGNEIVVFKLTKVTEKYRPHQRIFKDYIIGNYSYSTDGGATYIVNTITTPINEDPDANPMYASCIRDMNKISFGFRDVVLNKGFCRIYFEFLPGSLNQMQVTIKNTQGISGTFEGEPPFNPNFTLPTSMVVTRQ